MMKHAPLISVITINAAYAPQVLAAGAVVPSRPSIQAVAIDQPPELDGDAFSSGGFNKNWDGVWEVRAAISEIG